MGDSRPPIGVCGREDNGGGGFTRTLGLEPNESMHRIYTEPIGI